MDEINKLGVENAKPVFKDLGMIISKAIDIDADGSGNVSPAEWTGFAFVLLQRIIANYGNVGSFLAEIKDLNRVERIELLAAFFVGFDIKDDDKEQLIEDWLHFLVSSWENLEMLIGRTRKTPEKTVNPTA